MSPPRKNPHAVALGRLGGKVVTPKKLAHLQRARLSSGRAKKFAVGDRVHVKLGAPQAYRGQIGTILDADERAR